MWFAAREMRRRALVAAVGVGLGVAAGGCSASGGGGAAHTVCEAGSSCPNDPAPTQFVTDVCGAETAGPCGAAYQAYLDCYAAERVCAYDGTTDVAATRSACQAELNAVASCADGGLDGG